jgi:hypothetical protein
VRPVRRYALVEEADAVGDFPGEAHLVGDEQHGQVMLVRQASDHRKHFADQLRIERRGRLIEEKHPWAHRQRAGDCHSLLLAAGELRGVEILLVGQPQHIEQLQRTRLGLGSRYTEYPQCRLNDIAQHGHVGKQVEALEHHADMVPDLAQMAFRGLERTLAVRFVIGQALQRSLAVLKGLECHQDAQHGRFARTGWADQRDLLALPDAKVEVVEHGQGNEVLGDIGKFADGREEGWWIVAFNPIRNDYLLLPILRGPAEK